MKTFLAQFWKRRWCRMILWIGIVVGLASLSPFMRQSLFGPRFGDVPWCVWENELRYDAGDIYGPPTWFQQLLDKAGWREPRRGLDWSRPDLLPLFLHLAEDEDERVRQIVLLRLVAIPDPARPWERSQLRSHHEAATIALLRKHLHDHDAQCRLYAACGLWTTLKDREAKATLVAVVKANEVSLPRDGIAALGEVEDVPELFDWFVQWSEDPDWMIKIHAVRSMRHYGQRGVPVLRKAMLDPKSFAPRQATEAAFHLGIDAAALIPALLTLENARDSRIRENVQKALTNIDPREFPAPAEAKE